MSITQLCSKKFQMESWNIMDFWLNVRIPTFSQHVLTLFLKHVIEHCQLNTRTTTFPPYLESLFYTILHIFFSYNFTFDPKTFLPQINKLSESILPPLLPNIVAIQNLFKTDILDFHQYVSRIVDEHENVILSKFAPISSLMAMLRLLHFHPQSFQFFAIALKNRIGVIKTKEQSLYYLHLLKILLIAFPNNAGIELNDVYDSVKKLVSEPTPISDFACDVGPQIEEEFKHPGAAYLKLLQSIVRKNPIFDNSIPLFFDPSINSIEDILSSSSSLFHLVSSKIISFINFYMRKYHHSQKLLSIEEIISTFTGFSFSDDFFKQISEKLVLDDNKIEIEIDTQDILPPLFSFNMIPVDDQAIDRISSLFTNQISSSKLSEEKWSSQPLFVIGENLTFSVVVNSYVQAMISSTRSKNARKDSSKFKYFKPLFYLVPIASQGSDSLINFISEVDPIYSRFITNFANVIFKFVPLIQVHSRAGSLPPADEINTLTFPSIAQASSTFLSHEWFTDPNPYSMYRFALQHYALMARFSIPIKVWKFEFFF